MLCLNNFFLSTYFCTTALGVKIEIRFMSLNKSSAICGLSLFLTVAPHFADEHHLQHRKHVKNLHDFVEHRLLPSCLTLVKIE